MFASRSTAIDDDRGFTLVELLVVMIIIGVLATIALPIFLLHREKAHDSSTKADLNTLGKEVASYFVDGTGTLSLDFTTAPGSVIVSDGVYTETIDLTNGTAKPSSGASANMNDVDSWCVSLTDPKGDIKDFKYSATSGLGTGTC